MAKKLNKTLAACFMDMQQDLRFICGNVDASLRYAEGKHISFVAFNGLALFGGFGILRNLSVETTGGYVYVMMIMIMLVISAALIASIYSFIPIIVKDLDNGDPAACTNVLFFEHIKRHSVDSYAKLLCEGYLADEKEISPLDRCIMAQIIVNARLASRKFALFKWVAFFDLAAVILGLAGFLPAAVFG